MQNWTIHTDGNTSETNPGPGACAAILESSDYAFPVLNLAAFLGVVSNNQAEYLGVILGLSEARRLGVQNVLVLSDSKLVVEQMSGRWKVKHPIIARLHAQALEVADGFQTCSFEHIPREQNEAADALADSVLAAVLSLTNKENTNGR